MSVRTLSPKDHILIAGGIIVEGWKSAQVSFPNDEAEIQMNADGSHTFVENVGAEVFDMTITVDSAQNGCVTLATLAQAKALAPLVFVNSKGLKILSCLRSRFMTKSFGIDDGGSDTNTEFKVKGVADVYIPGRSL